RTIPISVVGNGQRIELTPDSPLAWGQLVLYRMPPWVWLMTCVALLALGRWRASLRHDRRLLSLIGDRAREDEIGTVVGPYRVIARLGGGGMAWVYRALPDATLDPAEAVALKVLRQPMLPEPLERFKREINICRTLDHPNIVRLIDWDDHHGHPYLVLELLEGTTLREPMLQGPMSAEQVWGYLQPVLQAVAYAHHYGVVHRDLKPENVMVTRRGKVKVLDFGIATVLLERRITGPGEAIGTCAYMAPEQINGEVVPASDQYALGLMAFEMLAGRLPWEELLTEVEVLYQHLVPEPFPDVRRFRPEVPEAVAAVVARMIEKDPARRFPDLQAASAAWP
ncbi:MAG: serine/threonine-protein kinase, partial [Candidatus Xenobia bacterium]